MVLVQGTAFPWRHSQGDIAFSNGSSAYSQMATLFKIGNPVFTIANLIYLLYLRHWPHGVVLEDLDGDEGSVNDHRQNEYQNKAYLEGKETEAVTFK